MYKNTVLVSITGKDKAGITSTLTKIIADTIKQNAYNFVDKCEEILEK